ncbi:hypothetical protein [Pseudomonas juntendi]|uniref:Uncharacterized protein n=1 Tax=Pseudomonas juntendi TaxID=2666183 RepID=A0AAJ5S4A7_9PSED|nr:hypothetical protein [Pseudomonas juntendi]WEA18641.1 hypothetical protein PWA60_15120 [Pseudomonas juntendi]
MTDTNKMRERFESAWRARYPGHGEIALKRSGLDPEDYCNTRVKDAWWAWQASLAALVVELPEPEPPESYGVTQQNDPEQYEALESRMGAQYSAIFKCKRAIEAQGLKVEVKP